ncbi:MAG: DUF1343 domain-containing protein [Paludibacter sp.]|nr:DUF1343 domain-containing protein [Bacteroidales bacterium]MCM1069681.1 DUF1343 domain-containing protein [Prevotella sp.]MCM1354327.1 DUF1343 domain-containing protein [Bacteroides sp.]MCM1443134.1 DUF1343 domain-containing protein [Muribaculum sp.]MCM1482369.1 DUF1343 domain-containing protein [Paludibacter sp.]
MKHSIHFLLLCLLLLSCKATAETQVKTGIEVLQEQGFSCLQGKRVGLCTNPTGIDHNLRSTIDILHEAENVHLVALFGPEHGVRGDIYAGDKVTTNIDPKTNIPVYSLFGATHKPTQEMMEQIDVMVYDIQDIGCRSFTFISTMGMLMEACAEYDKELIVLDRPNPLGGRKIEGNLAEDGYISFVSQFKIPYLYAQTCGELALMLNGEGMIGTPCRLTVIPMQGWNRDMTWAETGLPWVVASPHIPSAETAIFYPITGIFGELGYLNIGVGYTLPFQLIGAPWINADSLANALNALELPGIGFRPIYYKPFYSVFKGETCGGVQIYITDYQSAHLAEVQFLIVQELMRMYPDKDIFALCNQKRFGMFDKVCGTDLIRKSFGEHYHWADAANYWYKDVETYRALSAKYYLYE